MISLDSLLDRLDAYASSATSWTPDLLSQTHSRWETLKTQTRRKILTSFFFMKNPLHLKQCRVEMNSIIEEGTKDRSDEWVRSLSRLLEGFPNSGRVDYWKVDAELLYKTNEDVQGVLQRHCDNSEQFGSGIAKPFGLKDTNWDEEFSYSDSDSSSEEYTRLTAQGPGLSLARLHSNHLVEDDRSSDRSSTSNPTLSSLDARENCDSLFGSDPPSPSPLHRNGLTEGQRSFMMSPLNHMHSRGCDSPRVALERDMREAGLADASCANGQADATCANGQADATCTNGQADATCTNGLADASRANGLADASRANGLADASRTNGLADASRANGLADASRANVDFAEQDIPTSNPPNLVAQEPVEKAKPKPGPHALSRRVRGKAAPAAPLNTPAVSSSAVPSPIIRRAPAMFLSRESMPAPLPMRVLEERDFVEEGRRMEQKQRELKQQSRRSHLEIQKKLNESRGNGKVTPVCDVGHKSGSSQTRGAKKGGVKTGVAVLSPSTVSSDDMPLSRKIQCANPTTKNRDGPIRVSEPVVPESTVGDVSTVMYQQRTAVPESSRTGDVGDVSTVSGKSGIQAQGIRENQGKSSASSVQLFAPGSSSHSPAFVSLNSVSSQSQRCQSELKMPNSPVAQQIQRDEVWQKVPNSPVMQHVQSHDSGQNAPNSSVVQHMQIQKAPNSPVTQQMQRDESRQQAPNSPVVQHMQRQVPRQKAPNSPVVQHIQRQVSGHKAPNSPVVQHIQRQVSGHKAPNSPVVRIFKANSPVALSPKSLERPLVQNARQVAKPTVQVIPGVGTEMKRPRSAEIIAPRRRKRNCVESDSD